MDFKIAEINDVTAAVDVGAVVAIGAGVLVGIALCD